MKTQIYRDTHAVSIDQVKVESRMIVQVRLTTATLGADRIIWEGLTHSDAEAFLVELYETIGAVLRLHNPDEGEP